MKANRLYSLLLLGAVGIAAAAQEINLTEDVERLVEPEIRTATRVDVLPVLMNPAVKQHSLSLYEYSRHAPVTRALSFSEPIAWGDTIATSPYRGYAAAGYFPLLNAGVTAGYRIFDTDKTLLHAWMQYGGYSQKRDNMQGESHTWRQHEVALNVGLRQQVSTSGTLDANLGYNFSTSGMPMLFGDPSIGLHRMNLQAGWHASARKINYFAEMNLGLAAFANNAPEFMSLIPSADSEAASKVRELRYDFRGEASTPINRISSVALNAEADFLRYNHRAALGIQPSGLVNINGDQLSEYVLEPLGGRTLGVVSLRPALRAASKHFNANVGVRADVTVHSGKSFHIAPDVLMEWSPMSMLAVYGRAGGGEHLNSISELYEAADHYMLPNMAYGTSHIPFTLEAGLTLGQWNGLSLEVSGFFGRANDWLMPASLITLGGEQSLPVFRAVNLRGWKYEATLRYRYKWFGEAYIGYAHAPQTYEHGYYLWRDRARRVFKAGVNVKISRFDVSLDYEYRNKRATYTLIDYTVNPSGTFLNAENELRRVSLGDASVLNLGARYSITDQFSAFLNINNLLNSDHFLLYGVASRGVNGLAGVAYKF